MELDLPRVTEIIKPYTSIEYIPKDKLENAAKRGQYVHTICAAIAKGAWVPLEELNQSWVGYIQSFLKWQEKNVAYYEIIEKRYADLVEGFTGQIDAIIINLSAERILVDYKTSATKQKTYPIQMAAYYDLLYSNDIFIDKIMLLYLDKNGNEPKVEVVENYVEGIQVFHCMLTCWKYFNKKRKKKDVCDSPGD